CARSRSSSYFDVW
nr:immunoglobulin heavy chain junction region [Mus musculus]